MPTLADLPDLNDAHVCAAALASSADVIVTFNCKDFPQEVLSKHGLFAQHPDDFMLDLWDLKPRIPQEISVIIDQMAATKEKTWRDIAARLQKNNLPKFAKTITEWRFDNSVN